MLFSKKEKLKEVNHYYSLRLSLIITRNNMGYIQLSVTKLMSHFTMNHGLGLSLEK